MWILFGGSVSATRRDDERSTSNHSILCWGKEAMNQIKIIILRQNKCIPFDNEHMHFHLLVIFIKLQRIWKEKKEKLFHNFSKRRHTIKCLQFCIMWHDQKCPNLRIISNQSKFKFNSLTAISNIRIFNYRIHLNFI